VFIIASTGVSFPLDSPPTLPLLFFCSLGLARCILFLLPPPLHQTKLNDVVVDLIKSTIKSKTDVNPDVETDIKKEHAYLAT